MWVQTAHRASQPLSQQVKEATSLEIMGPGHGTSTHFQLQPRLRMCAATPPLSDIQNDNFNFCLLLLFLPLLFFLEFNDVIGCLMET